MEYTILLNYTYTYSITIVDHKPATQSRGKVDNRLEIPHNIQ